MPLSNPTDPRPRQVDDGPSTSKDGALQTTRTQRRRSSTAYARPSLAGWRDETVMGMALALAPSSQNTYTRVVREFHEFRQFYELPDTTPIPYDHLAQFCVYSHRRGLAPHTIRSQLSALAYWSKAQGLPDTTSDFRLHKIIAGWSRQQGPSRDAREPLSPTILKGWKETWPKVCRSQYEQILFHAAALTAFFCCSQDKRVTRYV
nr:uncharacterized protein LOC132783356 isoform X2 [Anolis sagrei ordinatus]